MAEALSKDEELATDLWRAVAENSSDEVTLLLQQRASPNHELYWSAKWLNGSQDNWNMKRPPLHTACDNGNLQIVRILVKGGANVDRGDGWLNSTPFHRACYKGHKAVVIYLIKEAKCKRDVTDDMGRSPLSRACDNLDRTEGCFDVAYYLISIGFGDQTDKIKLLFKACLDGKQTVVEELVEEHNLNPNGLNNDVGQTPLDVALSHWFIRGIDVAFYLVKRGCGRREDKGKLLCAACQCGRLDIVKELVEQHNLDILDTKDDEGMTPYEIAMEENNTEIVEYLDTLQSVSKQIDIPLSKEDSDALQKLLHSNNINLTPTPLTIEQAKQQLQDRGFLELASQLRTKLDEVIKDHQQYLKSRLEDLMTDRNTLEICYLKLFLVGPPGVGKTTTLNRLLKTINNIRSAGDKAKSRSTLLANCIQVLAFIADNAAEWLASEDIHEETKLLFEYLLHGFEPLRDKESKLQKPNEDLNVTKAIEQVENSETVLSPNIQANNVQPESGMQHSYPNSNQSQLQSLPTSTETDDKLASIKQRLQQLVVTGDYSNMARLLGSAKLLNINDIGGQPGFLEMLPALSTGPAMYLIFLDLSKDLDKLYKIPFSRDDTIITPFDAVHTVKATISQILSAIASVHCISRKFPKTLSEKFENFQVVTPLAALIGTHKDKLENPNEEIEQKSLSLKEITRNFEKFLVSSSLFSVDNYAGTEESDVGPIREFMNKIFHQHFKQASLPIRPKWLILGTLLRREYKIAKMKDCLEIGQMLKMDKDEIKFCLWYLDCIGTLMHYTHIVDDEGDWFKDHVICSPQVIFDSISQLIVASLRVLHSEDYVIEHDKTELIKKGQFSLESIEKYSNQIQVAQSIEKEEIIPAKQLVKLLNHANLLSPITHTEDCGVRVTYLMPAILECASPDELTNPPPPDENNPEPLFLTFSYGYVPTGTFCGLITQLISQGQKEICGMKWDLVEDGVKRNCVSFYVDFANKVTLLSHDRCYEIRIARNDPEYSLHDLCAYVISTVLFLFKTIYDNIVPQIAFYCPCYRHSASKDVNNLCTLVATQNVKVLCEKVPVTLRSSQQVWLGKHVTRGDSTELGVFVVSDDKLSFTWSKFTKGKFGKPRHIKTETTNESSTLTFEKVSDSDIGYYKCEVESLHKDSTVFTFIRALFYVNHSGSTVKPTSRGLTLKEVKKITNDARSRWVDLGVELDLEYSTLKDIRQENHFVVDDCFTEMLSQWLKRSAPSPSWAALHEALKSPIIARHDLAQQIKLENGGYVMKVDKGGSALKAVRRSSWDARSNWRDLGLELDINAGTLDAIAETCRHDADSCFTEMLAVWLECSSSQPNWFKLAAALRSSTIGREDLADNIQK